MSVAVGVSPRTARRRPEALQALLSAKGRIRHGGTYLMTVGGNMRVRVHLVMP